MFRLEGIMNEAIISQPLVTTKDIFEGQVAAVSYTHLTLPTNREV